MITLGAVRFWFWNALGWAVAAQFLWWSLCMIASNFDICVWPQIGGMWQFLSVGMAGTRMVVIVRDDIKGRLSP